MPSVSVTPSGGGLPSQWTADAHGYATIAPTDPTQFNTALTVTSPNVAADFVNILDLANAASNVLQVDTGGDLQLNFRNAAAKLLVLSPSATLFSLDYTGQIITAPPAPGTVQLVTATAAQISTTSDKRTVTPVTFNPGAAQTATCKVEISPDNVTYTTLWTETEPVGVALDGTIHGLQVYVPAKWYLKLTVTNATLGVTTYY